MLIFIKSLSGKSIPIDVVDTDTILSIKKKIQERENVPVDQQRLAYSGKDLEDAKTVAECGIKKESILHLILKNSAKNIASLSATRKSELNAAQTKTQKYYNPSVGLQDELRTYGDSESKWDSHSNPQGSDYDLGKDGEFVDFVVLMGVFVGAQMEKPVQSLRKKGFKVLTESNEQNFVKLLPKCDVAWIISGTDPDQNSKPKRASSSGESYPAWKNISKAKFVEAVVNFHQNGGGLFIWGDNDPLFEHANAVLPVILKSNVQLEGNTPANKQLDLGDATQTGRFASHIITTGIINLYEDLHFLICSNICYPNKLGCLEVLATSTDGHPVSCFADNEALGSDDVGRVMVDCGYTKNYTSWDEAGAARYIVNATIWLLGLEHKIRLEKEIVGKNKKANNTTPTQATTTTTTTEVNSNTNESASNTDNQNDSNNNNTKDSNKKGGLLSRLWK